ncbi:MAG: hypothetical protein IKI82_00005, partial [Lachnospiraceae bacterium]|nr:hypothetical protein [Lachnospiraceae bacterium]
GKMLFYRMDFEKNEAGPEILELKDGSLQPLSFTPPTACTLLQSVSVSLSGTRLLHLLDSFPVRSGESILILWTER